MVFWMKTLDYMYLEQKCTFYQIFGQFSVLAIQIQVLGPFVFVLYEPSTFVF